MTNHEHLDIIKEGPEAWNMWRKANPQIIPDLSHADLKEARLSETNPAFAFAPRPRTQINLANTILIGADLTDAILQGADLRNANLSRSDLSHADLRRADLFRADLSNSILDRTDLTLARLEGLILDNALIWETLFVRVNLSRVRGLESCRHGGPSVIDEKTFRKSGTLPVSFLHGCGLTDWQIEAAKLNQRGLTTAQVTNIGYEIIRLRSDPVLQFYSCFISYSQRDEAFVRRLHSDLQKRGIQCWYAPEDIKGGRKIHHQVEEAIRLHDKLLLILSENSMQSSWVEHEIVNARQLEIQEKRKMLFPIALVPYERISKWKLFWGDEGRDLAKEIREYFIPDFSNWRDDRDAYNKALERLIGDLNKDEKEISLQDGV